MTENLINRISFYLSSGGLFNPELADHLAVRNLLMECREALAQRTWVGLTNEERAEIKKQANYNWETTAGEYASKVQALTESKLKEKNNE